MREYYYWKESSKNIGKTSGMKFAAFFFENDAYLIRENGEEILVKKEVEKEHRVLFDKADKAGLMVKTVILDWSQI